MWEEMLSHAMFFCSHHSWDPHERWCKLDISSSHNVPCKSQDEKTAGQRGSEDPGRCGICGGPGLPWICGSWVQCRHHGAWKLIRNKCWRSCFQCPFRAFTIWTAFTNRLSECFRCFVRPPSSTIRIEFLVGEERDWAKLEATAAVSLRQQNRKLLVWRYIAVFLLISLVSSFWLWEREWQTKGISDIHARASALLACDSFYILITTCYKKDLKGAPNKQPRMHWAYE